MFLLFVTDSSWARSMIIYWHGEHFHMGNKGEESRLPHYWEQGTMDSLKFQATYSSRQWQVFNFKSVNGKGGGGILRSRGDGGQQGNKAFTQQDQSSYELRARQRAQGCGAPSADSRDGHTPTSWTQRLSLIDNYLQMKNYFSHWIYKPNLSSGFMLNSM